MNRVVGIVYFDMNGLEETKDGELKIRAAELPEHLNADRLTTNVVVFANSKDEHESGFRTAIIKKLKYKPTEDEAIDRVYLFPKQQDMFVRLLTRLAVQNGYGRKSVL